MLKPTHPDPGPATTLYTVSVRSLCEFAAKQGDLDRRFTPGPTALEGIAGHGEVASRRDPHYQREISLSGTYRNLLVRGRADGFDPRLQRLEEIKTYRGDLDSMPDNHRFLHWAQAKVYAFLMCRQLGLAALDVALVYFDVSGKHETVLCERHDADGLCVFYEALCERFLGWATQELAHRGERDAALSALAFPHGQFRAGQRALAEAVYKANAAGLCLLAQAPTGIGKTIATLFPALKACPTQRLDKIFFLTAKTPGRQLALDAMRRMQTGGPPGSVRVLELVARDKACEHPDKDCHGQSCPLARGFYDRLPAAREGALREDQMDKAALRQVALAHSVCPYYLAQEMLRWSDVVVGDYNHYFGLNAALFALTVGHQWRVSVLVDEAHNLIDRARLMFTAALRSGSWREARRFAPAVLQKPLEKVSRAWAKLLKPQVASYQAHPEPPDKFLMALQQLALAIGDHLSDNPGAGVGGLQSLYFDVLQFLHIAGLFGPHSLFDVSRDDAGAAPAGPPGHSTLCLRNVVPAPLLAERWKAAHSATLFSATLSPRGYITQMLGLPETRAELDLPSPFDPRQLQVYVARHISTRYSDRRRSLAALVELMVQQYGQTPGNYLAYFSSFEYLQMAAEALRECRPDVPVWQQSRRMDEAQRDVFLARFEEHGRGIGFAVLGGAFGEGIDLAGTRLIGAFIATLGLPQVNPVTEQMRRTVESYAGKGYAHTYLYPGIQKVVQAAGRVIRTEQDRGVLHLIDDRYAEAEVRGLLPRWWQVQHI